MFAGNWLTASRLGRFSRLSIASTSKFWLGTFLGIAAVSMWQQFSLTFGLDPILIVAVGVVLTGSFWLGQRWSFARTDSCRGTKASTGVSPYFSAVCYLVCCQSAWTLLHPFWAETMATGLGFVSAGTIESPIFKPLIALCIATACWFIPGTLWGAFCGVAGGRGPVWRGVSTPKDSVQSEPDSSSQFAFGIAAGMLMNCVVFAPSLGTFVPAMLVSFGGLGLVVWLRWRGRGRAGVSSINDAHPQIVEQASATAVPAPTHEISLISWGMAFLIGGLAACHIRLLNQLMPHGSFVLFAESAGILVGMGCGAWCVRMTKVGKLNAVIWSGLMAAAVSSSLLAIQPSLVNVSLSMNAVLTNVTTLLAGRVALLVFAMAPFGVTLALLNCRSERPVIKSYDDLAGSSMESGNAVSRFPVLQQSVGSGTPFVLGVAIGTYCLGGTFGVIPFMAGCSALLLLASGFLKVKAAGFAVALRPAIVGGSMLAIVLTLPLWRSHDDASRTAKILFSTPAFVAYRSGWNIRELGALDDLRLIHRGESESGSLTLWRGRVAELHVREAGIPRSVLTKDHDVVPQFAPEVLQAVYSLTLADRPGRVMLLGLSAGVPLSTCLEFPVREVVCIEGNSSLIDLVRGPLAVETGNDPLNDDRVKLQRISPELSLMTSHPEPFDVILSSPTSSSLTQAAAQFTIEFYERASKHLTDHGLFCQRFECLDYGPEPLQIALKSMRQAFRKVIAIETAAGEFLLFGSKSEDVFDPNKFISRVELPHVVRILARSGLDWSTLLNQPAYDHEAIGEICADTPRRANSAFNGSLGARTTLEVMRWGNKQQEVQSVLTSTRLTKAPFWTEPSSDEPKRLDEEIHLSRRSRLVEWLGDSRVSLETLRRLGEVAQQQKLVHEHPDTHWWQYRKSLREQLQNRPRAAVQQVKAIDENHRRHPEDLRRKEYFVALGNAVDLKKTPTRQEVAAVEQFIEPYDPLLSYFARQEIADLLARCQADPGRELAYRLHVIFFAPTRDSSVRNVATAIETLVQHPEAMTDDAARFDTLNGLIQVLRSRWETRQFINETSVRKVLKDVDQSIVAAEKGVHAMDELAASAGVADADWKLRRTVIERLLLRPLRSYRAEIKSRQTRSELQTKVLMDEVNGPDREGSDE
jgi:hypothetical protein